MSHWSFDQTMSIARKDRWLLPRHQAEYPAWDLLSEETLHGRREATFLVLGAIFVVTATLLVVLGTSRSIDLSAVVTSALASMSRDVELPLAMRIPFGVIPFALGGLALALVCELYNRRRAAALVATGFVIILGLCGLMRLADVVNERDAMLGPALGFASCYLVGYLLTVPLFDALKRRMAGRHLWFRLVIGSPAAQLAGWTAFGLAMYGHASLLAPGEPVDTTAITALATGSALYTLACVVVLSLPIALIARGLRLFLRVAHPDSYAADDDDYREGPGAHAIELLRRRQRAEIVEDGVPEPLPARRRSFRSTLQPYSSAEMRFFAEGDRLAESGAES
jgi:uncharacterized PurR-regulated membrane protein YhhQ (DUF165 family)